MILPFLLAAAQSDRLPPANPLPPPGAEEAAVLAPVNALLRALETGDRAAVLADTLPGGGAAAALEAPDGRRRFRRMTWAEFAAQLTPENGAVQERIFSPAVEIDGDIAMVWARYTTTVAGKLSHCGYDHFDLVREQGRWRVLNATWSQRSTGCEAP